MNGERFLGYDKDGLGHLVINEVKAKIIRRIYWEYLDGKGYDAIASVLIREKIPTAAGKLKW